MTIELSMLLYTTLLLFALVIGKAARNGLTMGASWAVSNREETARISPLSGRLKRTADNHKEGLLFFAPLALIVAVAGLSSPQTALGSQIFFYSRLVHAAAYIAGIGVVRSIAWGAGIAGLLMMVLALI